MLRNLYAHPNGQIPAYEWNFSDVNPPVHAWATLFLYNIEKTLGRADFRFLERSFQGLMQNFNWWVNRKDPQGKNVFAGGFLGLDNIGVFDRSSPLPTGGHLDQADGTAWMAFYCQNMLEIALILTDYDSMYEEISYRFLEHFLWITYAMDRIGEHHDQMWDSEDGFFYDLLHFPNGDAKRLRVRSMVGLLPLCASTVFESGAMARHPRMLELIELFKKRHPDLLKHIAPADGKFVGYADRRLMSVCNKEKIGRILAYLLDENEFLSSLRYTLSVALPPGASIRIQPRRTGIQSSISAGGVEHGNVRWQFQLARACLDAGERFVDPGFAEPLPVLRR